MTIRMMIIITRQRWHDEADAVLGPTFVNEAQPLIQQEPNIIQQEPNIIQQEPNIIQQEPNIIQQPREGFILPVAPKSRWYYLDP